MADCRSPSRALCGGPRPPEAGGWVCCVWPSGLRLGMGSGAVRCGRWTAGAQGSSLAPLKNSAPPEGGGGGGIPHPRPPTPTARGTGTRWSGGREAGGWGLWLGGAGVLGWGGGLLRGRDQNPPPPPGHCVRRIPLPHAPRETGGAMCSGQSPGGRRAGPRDRPSPWVVGPGTAPPAADKKGGGVGKWASVPPPPPPPVASAMAFGRRRAARATPRRRPERGCTCAIRHGHPPPEAPSTVPSPPPFGPCQGNDPADAHPSAHKSVLESANPRMDSECASGRTRSTARATARLRDDPHRVIMSSGERPLAAKGKEPNTEALCQPPPPRRPPLHHHT